VVDDCSGSYSPLAAGAAGTSAVGIREQGAAGGRWSYVVTAGPVRQLRETDIIFRPAPPMTAQAVQTKRPGPGEPAEPRYPWALCAAWMACRGATRPQHDA
jgi:hypothetical protein